MNNNLQQFTPSKNWQLFQSTSGHTPSSTTAEGFVFGENIGSTTLNSRIVAVLKKMKLIAYGVRVSFNTRTYVTNWNSAKDQVAVSTLVIGAGISGFLIKDGISEEYVQGDEMGFISDPQGSGNAIHFNSFSGEFKNA